MKLQQQIEDLAIIVIILFSINFFSFTLIPDESFLRSTGLYALGGALIGATILIFLFKRNIITTTIDKRVLFFILCMVASTITSYIYWEQSFFFSFKSYTHYLIYFLYFILIYLDVSRERIIRIIKFFFFASLVVFLIDYIKFPDPIFAWRSEERRAGITILFYGQGFTFLGALYYLNEFFKSRRLIYLGWYIIAFFCLFFLTQSRMNLVALVSVFFYNLLLSDIRQKFLIAALLVVGAVGVYFTSSAFQGIKEDSAEQSKNAKEDIRISAQRYFLFDLQAGVPTMIFGNGVPNGKSALGLEMLKANEMGYYTADVGLTGIYNYFGILGVIAWILFFISAFTCNPSENSTYIKGYFITLLTTALVAFSIFEPGYMPATMVCLYLIRLETTEEEDLEYEEEEV